MKVLSSIIFLFYSINCFAACSSPPGINGSINFDSATGSLNLCDNTNWSSISTTSSSPVEIKVKSATESVTNSTAVQNDDDLFFSIAANETVQIELIIFINAHATPDFKYDINGPAAPTAIFLFSQFSNSTAKPSTGCGDLITAYATTTECGWSSNGDKFSILRGTIINGANAGTVNFRWSQRVVDAVNPSQVKLGSYIKITRL